MLLALGAAYVGAGYGLVGVAAGVSIACVAEFIAINAYAFSYFADAVTIASRLAGRGRRPGAAASRPRQSSNPVARRARGFMIAPVPTSPAAWYLRILWNARLPFLIIVAACVGGAAVITALQTPLYASRTLMSVRPPPDVVAEFLRTHRPKIGADGRLYDENDPLRQSGPGRWAPRLTAPGLVTLAARDAGLLSAGQSLDDTQAAAWVTAEAVDGADLVRLTVWQPSPAAAQKLAEAIVARGLEANRRDEAELIAPEVHRRLVVVDLPTLPASPSFPRRDVNLAAGFGIGVLLAAAFVAARQAIKS